MSETVSESRVEVVRADYGDPRHAADLLALLEAYARDPMGGGRSLDAHVRQRLVPELAKRPHCFSLLCYLGGQPAGLANCVEGFSTFAAAPLVNIHDLVVAPAFRGRGLARRLLQAVEDEAHARGCCKITLEVLEANATAKAAYRSFGFAGYELDPATGKAEFWEKKLGP